MDQRVGAAAMLPESKLKALAVVALARSATVSEMAARHGVSRKFVYQQIHKAHTALDDAFMAATLEECTGTRRGAGARWHVPSVKHLLKRAEHLGVAEGTSSYRRLRVPWNRKS